MTVLHVDMEHDRVLAHPELGAHHRAKLEETRARLAAAAGEPCLSIRFSHATLARVDQIAPRAMVIGGCTTDWADYDGAALADLLATIRAAPVPILGVCAGHQLLGLAHGAPWGPLGPLRDGEPDPDPRFAPGQRKQRGFQPVRTDPASPLFRDLPPNPVFFQSHYWQLERVPDGFVPRASSPWSPIQAIERRDRPVFGVQFHLERYDTTHPAGATVLRNFFALANPAAARLH